MSIARLTPSVLDGQTPEQLDRVVDRWQRMLSGVDSRTRLYFYLLRRPIQFEDQDEDKGSSVAALGRRKRRAFLEKRVQSVSAYVAWAHDPGMSAVTTQKTGGPWWMAYAKNWMARRRNQHESVYLESSIAEAAGSFRQLVEASRALVDDLTAVRVLDAAQGSRFLNELTNRPGSFWDGATGSGMNWRLAVSELEAERRNLRLDGEPVILYSLLSPPGAAKANLLQALYRLDATMTVTLEWRPQGLDTARRKIRGAQRHYFSKRYSMSAAVQETEGTATAMVDTAAEAESERLGDALVELETDGIAYGDLALTVALHGPLSLTESLDGDIRRIFTSHDAKVIREGYGQLPAWFSRMPAQPRRRQCRSVFVSAGAVASMAPIFGPPAEGVTTNVALVCESGRIYSFLVTEQSKGQPHLVVRIDQEAQADPRISPGKHEPAFVARGRVVAYQQMAETAIERARAAQIEADSRIADAAAEAAGDSQAFQAEYPTRLKFPYRSMTRLSSGRF